MDKYIIVYFGGDHSTDPEEGKKQFNEYQAWLNGLGARVVLPMNPYQKVRTIHSNGAIELESDTSMSGHTIIEANSIEEAVELAKSCPFLKLNGRLEVAKVAH